MKIGVIFWTSYLVDSRYIPIPPSFLTITHIEEKRPDNLEISTDCPFSKNPVLLSETRVFKNPVPFSKTRILKNPVHFQIPRKLETVTAIGTKDKVKLGNSKMSVLDVIELDALYRCKCK